MIKIRLQCYYKHNLFPCNVLRWSYVLSNI